ncbi:MAG: hypothetical protein M3R02_24855 [Chloroflexota bacterium]|nr:hypothetical protein [Chloroflexota bacterium]
MRAAAADRVVEAAIVAEVERYTTPLTTTPQEALQAELERTAGAIEYLRRTLDQFPGDPPAAWLQMYAGERQHLARIADRMAALEMKTSEVEAAIRGRLVDQLQTAMVGILTDLGHNPDDEVTRGIVLLHIRRVMGQADPAPVQPAIESPPSLVAPPPAADF